jgi:hypothetical protein
MIRPQMGIPRLRGRVRSTRPPAHPGTQTVRDDQGTRTAIPTVADFVANFPHRIKTSHKGAVRPIPFPVEVDLLSRLNWDVKALLKSNIDLPPTLCDNPPMIAGSRCAYCGTACLDSGPIAITVWPYPQKKY